ncbi:zf-HC2 domain-containing protein [Archangium violaceum]|uniref:anti-sigma factor family protein n=1 Tax=Archangium violaceum TaxID=83451 RepID=UPI00193C395A|nr:zf-HC2 domain-containing protein [Archangium violaceum]QRK05412.1 zf-HC2 domain-containing protein [Archangium violaceum]
MKPQGAHAHEDRLLDFAYGELPPSEARLMEQHVQGCSRCSEALAGIRGVRVSMSRLPLETAPDAGLESLLAYAQQSARRSAAGTELPPRWWRRLLAPALGVAAMSVFGVVVVQVDRDVNLSPALKQEAAREKSPRGGDKDEAVAAEVPPASAPATSAVPAPAPVPAELAKLHQQYDDKMRDDLSAESLQMKPAPKPVSRSLQPNWSNTGAGSGGGFPPKKVALDTDEESRGSDAFGSRESWKLKGGMVARKNRPSSSTEGDAEPAQVLAEAEQGAPALQEPRPGESLVASAAPPPPPPTAQYQAPTASVGAFARAEGLEAKRADRSALRAAPSPAELLMRADEASRSGNREQEVALLRDALAAGAQGAQRVDALSRLCDAETALGRRRIAIEVCKQVVMMAAPGSREARLAERRLENELQSPADEIESPVTK